MTAERPMALTASPVDLPELAACLEANGLPTEDLTGPGKEFFAFEGADGSRVGFGGIEYCGEDALLRSVVTEGAVRGRGFGRAIIEWLVRHAFQRGLMSVYLLTTTAPGFFKRCGFSPIDRSGAPQEIAATEEFSQLCPSDAVFMVYHGIDRGTGEADE